MSKLQTLFNAIHQKETDLLLQFFLTAILRGRTFQFKSKRVKEKLQTKPYLNVGAGPFVHPAFINIDLFWQPHLDICWDITKNIPFCNNTLQGIFTEHCLEHIPLNDCRFVLAEFFRILKPGGVVRIIVPDTELYLDLYQQEKAGENVTFPMTTPHELATGFTPMMSINRSFRDHGHRYSYDARTLRLLLTNAGFVDVKKETFNQGRVGYLLIDTQSRAIESLYIEASKP